MQGTHSVDVTTAQVLAQECLDARYGKGKVAMLGEPLEFESGWVFFICDAEDGETFFGNAPVIVDRTDGLVYGIGSGNSVEYYLSGTGGSGGLVRVQSLAQAISHVLEAGGPSLGAWSSPGPGEERPRLFSLVHVDGEVRVFDDASEREVLGTIEPQFDELWFDWNYRGRDPLGGLSRAIQHLQGLRRRRRGRA